MRADSRNLPVGLGVGGDGGSQQNFGNSKSHGCIRLTTDFPLESTDCYVAIYEVSGASEPLLKWFSVTVVPGAPQLKVSTTPLIIQFLDERPKIFILIKRFSEH